MLLQACLLLLLWQLQGCVHVQHQDWTSLCPWNAQGADAVLGAALLQSWRMLGKQGKLLQLPCPAHLGEAGLKPPCPDRLQLAVAKRCLHDTTQAKKRTQVS